MRILPQPWLGLHEAFPEHADDSLHPGGFGALSGASLLGISRFGLGLLGRAIATRNAPNKPLPWASALQITAYSAVGLLGLQGIVWCVERHAAKSFLHDRGIELPRQRLADRLAYFDADNAFLAGGFAGVFLASRLRQPWAITGWKRYLGSFAIGGDFASAAFLIYRHSGLSAEEREILREQARNHRAQTAKWSPLVLRAGWSFKVTHPVGAPSLPAFDMKITGSPLGENPGGSGHGNGDVVLGGSIGIGDDGTDNIGRDGPHLTTTVADESEPIPFANTNYAWTSNAPIEDLEKHIKMLQQRRQRLAQEAEFLWAWLSEKEAVYYNSPDFDPKAQEDSKEKYFLEFLGSHHTKTWLEASSCDWMIADAKKRIEQLKSKGAVGNVKWRAGCSDAAATTEPKFAMRLLRGFEQAMMAMQSQLEQIQSQTSAGVADPNDEFDVASNEKVFNPVQRRMTTQREMMVDMRKQIDQALEQTSLMKQAASDIIAEGEERIKVGSPIEKR